MVWEGLRGKGEQGLELESFIIKSNDNRAPSRRLLGDPKTEEALSGNEDSGYDEDTDYLSSSE